MNCINCKNWHNTTSTVFDGNKAIVQFEDYQYCNVLFDPGDQDGDPILLFDDSEEHKHCPIKTHMDFGCVHFQEKL